MKRQKTNMGKQKRKKKNTDKKDRSVKERTQREQEAENIKQQINSLGLGDGNVDVKTFFTELDNFVTSGVSWSDKIKLHGYTRIIDATLSMNPNITSKVALLYDKDV